MRALIADDDAATAALLLDVVARMGGVATVRWDAEGAREALRSAPIDIVILGFNSGITEVVQLLRWIRGASGNEGRPNPTVPVLLLATEARMWARLAFLDVGADRYLPKPVNAALASATILSLVRITTHAASPRFRGLHLDPERRLVLHGKKLVQLTRTQMEILQVLVREGPGLVTRQRLMDSCSQKLSSSGLNFHIHHLRQRLGRHAIQTVRGGGFQLLAVAPQARGS